MGRSPGIRWHRLAVAGALVAVVALASASAAAPGRKGTPRIVSARMLDADRDGRADAVRLSYSLPVRHRLDRDGRYPFRVAGYRIRSVAAAHGKTLLILLRERRRPDGGRRPAIRYVRTRSQPVLGRAHLQAVAQVFRRTRPFAKGGTSTTTTTAPAPPTTTAPTTTTTTVLDSDHDGTPDSQDCAPKDASIHPGAPDPPDLKFVDSNCDGIDGDVSSAIFVSPSGSDGNPGTIDRPKKTLQAAVVAAAATTKDVYAAAGTYTGSQPLALISDVGIYGGYGDGWHTRGSSATTIVGAPEAVVADADTGVTLQLLTLEGHAPAGSPGASTYGLRAVNGSKIALSKDVVRGGDANAGADGAAGANGSAGGNAANGQNCDTSSGDAPPGGSGGSSPVGRRGGNGGAGGKGGENTTDSSAGGYGAGGQIGSPGGYPGLGGTAYDDGGDGLKGGNGARGGNGGPGAGGSGGSAGTTWLGAPGSSGTDGEPGNGGGGGGGGGGQYCFILCNGGNPYAGGGGGGGGGGGAGGRGGGGGEAGGGSFGVYLWNSTLAIDSATTIAAGRGGDGGKGGPGGLGGIGGFPGAGGKDCNGSEGIGGLGGFGGGGGNGGPGGGGAGGPSIGLYQGGTSTVTFGGTIAKGSPGHGGAAVSPGADGMAADVYP